MSTPILSRTGILAFLDDDSRQALASYGNVLSTMAGQVLISEGVANTTLHIVLEGTFNVSTIVEGRDVHFDMVNPGDCLGEVAIFHPDIASATVTSLTVGKVWSIDSLQLQQFLTDWPTPGCAVILGIATILSRRLKHADDVIRANEIVPTFLNVRAKKPMTGPLPG